MILTQHLRERLLISRAIVDEWAEREYRKADAQALMGCQLLDAEQRSLDEKSTRLLALQLERGCHINNENDDDGQQSFANDQNHESPTEASTAKTRQLLDLEDEIQRQTTANARLDDQLAEMKRHLQDVLAEHEHEKARAIATGQQSVTIAATKKATVHDLTQGIVNYKYLGLDFEKAEHGRLRFVFTQLNPLFPDQKYSFCLETTEDEEWSIVDCNPPILSEERVEALVAPLNETNDMWPLVRGMRQAFLKRL